MAIKGIDTIKKFAFADTVANAIEEESKKIQIPQIEIRGILEVSSKRSDGVEVIKSVLVDATEATTKSNPSTITIAYLGAPRYRIAVRSDNFKIAEKAMAHAIEKIEKGMTSNKEVLALQGGIEKEGILMQRSFCRLAYLYRGLPSLFLLCNPRRMFWMNHIAWAGRFLSASGIKQILQYYSEVFDFRD